MNTLLIQFSFIAVSKILVSTGYPTSSARKTEIINLENESLTCQDLGNYPFGIYGGVGSNIGSLAVICGGTGGIGATSEKQCYKLVAGEWQQFATMTTRRHYAAVMGVGNSLMIFGGIDYSNINGVVDTYQLQSTEIINENGQVSQGPNMPADDIESHAIATVNASTLIISGGRTTVWPYTYDYSRLTWYFNHVTQEFQEGPSLMEGRRMHASGTIVDHETNENIVVVAGGYGGISLDSTELLINGEWQQGKNHANNKNAFICFFCVDVHFFLIF